MKFEIKTDNEDFSRTFYFVFLTTSLLSLIIVISNISIKLGNISKHFEINYLCRILIIDKSPSSFKKLSKLSNQTSKQKIWDFCKETIK